MKLERWQISFYADIIRQYLVVSFRIFAHVFYTVNPPVNNGSIGYIPIDWLTCKNQSINQSIKS